MPPRIIPILDRLRQDFAATLSRETIEEGCRQKREKEGKGGQDGMALS